MSRMTLNDSLCLMFNLAPLYFFCAWRSTNLIINKNNNLIIIIIIIIIIMLDVREYIMFYLCLYSIQCYVRIFLRTGHVREVCSRSDRRMRGRVLPLRRATWQSWFPVVADGCDVGWSPVPRYRTAPGGDLQQPLRIVG